MRNSFLVFLFTVFCFGVVTHEAYEYTKLNGSEDIVLMNPSFMVAHYNQITFPVYDEFGPGNSTVMYDHPPFHYIFLGLFMKVFALRNAIIVYHLMLVAILLLSVLYLRETDLFKIFFIGGITGFVVYSIRETIFAFQVRPEMALTLCWVIGIVWLRNAMLNNWKISYTIVGTLLFTIASITHYFAMPGFVGIFFFWLAGFLKVGNFNAKRAVIVSVVLSGTILTFYMVYFVLPVKDYIYWLTFGTQKLNAVNHSIFSLADKMRFHAEVHHIPIPIGVLSAIVLMFFANTRVIGLMAFPMVFGLTFYLNIQKVYYIVPELLLFFTAIAVTVHWCVKKSTSYPLRQIRKPSVLKVLSYVGITVLLVLSISSHSYTYTEYEAIRKAAQRVIGSQASVSGHHSLWYASGAHKWKNEDTRLMETDTLSKAEIFKSSDYIAIPVMTPTAVTIVHSAGAYYDKKMELNCLFVGYENFIIYGEKGPEAKSIVAYCVPYGKREIWEYVKTNTGNFVVGSVAGFDSFEPKKLLPNVEYQYTAPTYLPLDSANPNYIVYFIASKESFEKLNELISNEPMKKWKLLDKHFTGRKTTSIDEFMEQSPILKNDMVFEKFNDN